MLSALLRNVGLLFRKVRRNDEKRYVLFLLVVLLLTGCGRKQEMTDANKIDSAQEGQLNEPVNREETITKETGAPSMDPADMLTPEGASEVALNHAHVPKEDAVGLHAQLEIDDGIPQYEVEFRDGHIQYEYHIHAETGEVLEFERDD